MLYVRYLSILLLSFSVNSVLHAGEIKFTKTVTLQSPSGESIDIANIQMTRESSGGFSYQLDIDNSKFGDYFLSMRPFKCFQGPIQMLCHLPYPYQKNQKITANDLKDLEYDLLFIHRKSTDYGINPWNGVYYKLTLGQDNNLSGVMKEVNLDILASPPEGGVTRPITDMDMHEADPDSHSYPFVVIK